MTPGPRPAARRARAAALALLLALPPVAGLGQVAPAPAAVPGAGLAERVAAERERLGLPALAVGVLDRGRAEVAVAGLADLEHAVAATEATRFRLASVSKPLTAALALRLAEQGRLDLDADVRRLGGALAGLRHPATPRQLLAHTAGIRHYRGQEMASTRPWPSLAASLAIFARDPLVAAPGTQHVYTTYGYTVLGVALERAAGEPFFDALRRLVLDPAGMDATVADAHSPLVPGRARGYRRGPDGTLLNAGLADTSYKVPGGGLLSTAGDLLRFAAALFEGRLLDEGSRRAMWTPARTRGGAELRYGLGWSLEPGRAIAFHTGAQQGTTALLWLDVANARAVAVLTNLEGQRDALRELARVLDAGAGGSLTLP
ncbi:MAG: beta-lactamase family protein [Vicinamibacteria bacterium]|nr:beta-lactamase family protein [Vicinamibacteria bacterium]